MPQAQTTLRDFLLQEAERNQIPGDLALAMVGQESGGTHSSDKGLTTSKAGALGLFQLMPETAKELGVDPSDPIQNIQGGLKYFRQQMDAFGGDVRLALAAYNAGPGRVKNGRVPEIPETQQYVQSILTKWQQGAGATAAPMAGAAPVAPATAAAAPTAPASPALADISGAEKALNAASEFGGGLRARLAQMAIGGVDLVQRGLGTESRLKDTPTAQALMTAPKTTAGSVGEFAGEALSFAIPGSMATKALKGARLAKSLIQAGVTAQRAKQTVIAANAAAQAVTAAGVAKIGGSESVGMEAALAAASPIAGELITSMGPAIRKAATTKLAAFLEKGVSGDITPKLNGELLQAAGDLLTLPIQRTWRATARMARDTGVKGAALGTVARGRTQAMKDIGTELAGPAGGILVPIKPLLTELDAFVDDVMRIRPATPAGHLKQIPLRPEVVTSVRALKDFLGEHFANYPNGLVPARDLHDVKSIWSKAVYPQKSTAGFIAETKDLLTSAEKEARLRGTGAIMDILRQNAPQVAELDQAATRAARLAKFASSLSAKEKTGALASPLVKSVAGAAGAAAGSGIGAMTGGFAGGVAGGAIGAPLGYAAGRVLSQATQSPRWKLVPLKTRAKLADAIARGDSELVRKIATPLALAATADQDLLTPRATRESPGVGPSGPSSPRSNISSYSAP